MRQRIRPRHLAMIVITLGLLFVLYRVNMAEDGGLLVGSIAAVLILFLIAMTLRWNHETLATLRRRGPKYDPRDRLRAERERMLSRTSDDLPQEEHKSD